MGKVFTPAKEVRSPLPYCPRSSLPAKVLAWLAGRLAHLLPPRPPGRGGNPTLPLEVRLDAVAAVVQRRLVPNEVAHDPRERC